MLKSLSDVRVLWGSFALTLILTLGFGVVTHLWQFAIIDEMYVAEEIRDHIEAMTKEQRHVHAWMTGTLDVAYPFAYGAFFIGIALRYFGRFGLFLALPSLLCIPADLIEGLAQIMLLTGHEGWMAVKLIATPIKLLLFGTGLVVSLFGLGLALRHRFSQL
jgi:hypothetical protein